MSDDSPLPQTEPLISPAAARAYSPLEEYYASLVDGQPPVSSGPLPPIQSPPEEYWPYLEQKRKLTLALVILVGVFTAFNLLSVFIMEQFDGPGWVALPLSFMLGGYVTEVALLSCGIVFTCLPFWQRLSLHWLLAPLLLGAWLLAWQFPATLNGPGQDDIAVMFLGLPLFLLAAQLPLWGLRLLFQWRIVAENDPQAGQPLRPLAIRDLMIATVVVALSFAAARAAPAAGSEPDYWLVWGIVCMSVAGVSAFSISWVLYWALARQSRVWSGVATLLLASLSSVAAVGLLYAIEPMARREFWTLLGVSGFICGYAFSFTVLLWLARYLGLRLVIGRAESGSLPSP